MIWFVIYLWAGWCVEWWARCSPGGWWLPRGIWSAAFRMMAWPYGFFVIASRYDKKEPKT